MTRNESFEFFSSEFSNVHNRHLMIHSFSFIADE
jgi:hypothetical protein